MKYSATHTLKLSDHELTLLAECISAALTGTEVTGDAMTFALAFDEAFGEQAPETCH